MFERLFVTIQAHSSLLLVYLFKGYIFMESFHNSYWHINKRFSEIYSDIAYDS